MKKIVIAALAIAMAAGAPALADGKKNNPSNGHCPPGLAKKNPPCIPPGQAKKFYRGDFITDDDREYLRLYEDWRRLSLPKPPEGFGYYRFGDNLLLLDQESGEVVELFDALINVLD